jgi:hypothetical protein
VNFITSVWVGAVKVTVAWYYSFLHPFLSIRPLCWVGRLEVLGLCGSVDLRFRGFDSMDMCCKSELVERCARVPKIPNDNKYYFIAIDSWCLDDLVIANALPLV